MMLLDLIAVGRMRSRELAALCGEFTKRLGAYSRLNVTELPDSDVAGEGRAICRELDRERGSKVVVLSEEGRLFTTVKLAEFLKNCDTRVVFVVGGPFGLAPEVKARADLLWSLSPLTFTHELARLLLLEQLYRALNFNAGGGYHHR
jgi:23S rRNA (pseudouridine1915-N3)-methyltransferase